MKLVIGATSAAALAILALLGAVFLWSYTMGHVSPYCPWSHVRDTSVCVILDEDDTGRVLIQHANLDSNRYYFEIRQEEVSQYYKFPEFIHRLAPDGYSARLLPGMTDQIAIDGTSHQLERLPANPWR